jgi:hypothetical protein
LKVETQAARPEKPVPVFFQKPLSIEDSTIIGLLTDMYVGIDQPMVRFENDERVTLHVPRIRRVFKESFEAYLAGTPAIEFAARLERRDVADFERASDPCPDRVWPSAANE